MCIDWSINLDEKNLLNGEKIEKLGQIPNLDRILTSEAARNSRIYFRNMPVSHVVGVLQICFLLKCAGGWLSQHCCVVATAIFYKCQQCALLNRANKGIAWIQARSCELKRRTIQRKVKLSVKVFQYVELLKRIWLHVRKEELLSSVWGCKRGIAQGKLPYGL